MPLAAACVVSLLGSLTGALVGFAVQLSEYQIDAAAGVCVVLLHEIGWEAEPTSTHRARVGVATAV